MIEDKMIGAVAQVPPKLRERMNSLPEWKVYLSGDGNSLLISTHSFLFVRRGEDDFRSNNERVISLTDYRLLHVFFFS